MSISKLLIANRGEIAVRIARTAHAMGISTVGVYSEPDANSLHVDVVDTAISLGGATPAEPYLRTDAVLAAAVDTGCDAIHPGYGFLAENAAFAQQVIDAGLLWVGPTPQQIALLGDKVAAKTAAVEAGVPTTAIIEVAEGAVPSDVALPALVKAAAGGGGRGMRIVRSGDDLAEAIESASREAAAAFGDGTVFIEPYIENGRHVEVQIMGDSHGNVVHLGERECSIQRRNQKVVEESPSAGIDDDVRTALTSGALALAAHIGYENAGTVEFLVGADGTITFLEVNTRLQVEHPVTEAVTGLDLVELQLRVAAGEPLPIAQDDVTITGHAIEVRVVAEDPAAGWMPSVGVVDGFSIAASSERESVRVDTGIRAGAEVSPDYDSLLAKVISHASTRSAAAGVLARSLRGAEITGVRTNLNSLAAILSEADFLAAATPTSYLETHPDVAQAAGPTGDDAVVLLIAAAISDERFSRAADSVTGFAPSGWRNMVTHGQRTVWRQPGEGSSDHPVELSWQGEAAAVSLGPWPVPLEDGAMPPDERSTATVRVLSATADSLALEVDGRRTVVGVRRSGDGDGVVVHTRSAAGALSWSLAPRFVEHDLDLAGGGPICPLPGTVIAVHVSEGDTVAEGAVLMVVEAMKMEHKITAGAASVVAAVHFAEGDRVDSGDLLLTLDAAEPRDAETPGGETP